MPSARLASVCCRTSSERVQSAQTFVKEIEDAVRVGAFASREPFAQEKLARAANPARRVVDEVYTPVRVAV